ncbi:MAG TPA: competence/damage-inducible protein A [Terriglobales bacterium]|nr:competence/damage-inducible protein A [Terriglobales bacterium]
MRAEIIAIGSELLGPSRLDTNSLFLTRELQRLGVPVTRKAILPDQRPVLVSALTEACRRTPLVFTTGGLGPTEDDLTVGAAAEALGVALHQDPAAVQRLRRRFRNRHARMSRNNLQQSMRLASAQWLPNPLGSAMGQWCSTPLGALILLPGPPVELHRMFLDQVQPRLAAMLPPVAIHTRVISIVGMDESRVDSLAAPLYRRVSNPATSILATAPQQVELHLTASAPTPAAAQARTYRLARQLTRRLGAAVFSQDRQTLADVVGQLLRERHEYLAVAESCTGGLLGAALTEPAGASDYFLGGVLAYANAVKERQLGVRAATLRRFGAVSGATAKEMAAGVSRLLQADWGVAITGIAGPAGGSRAKPVGTVFLGLCRAGRPPRSISLQLSGDRDRIRRASVQRALNELRLALLDVPIAAVRRRPGHTGHPLPGSEATSLSDRSERPDSGVGYPPR